MVSWFQYPPSIKLLKWAYWANRLLLWVGRPHFTNLYSSLPLIWSSSSLQNFPQFSLASFDIQNALSPFWHLFMVKHYLLGKTAYNICTEDEGILWTVSTLYPRRELSSLDRELNILRLLPPLRWDTPRFRIQTLETNFTK